MSAYHQLHHVTLVESILAGLDGDALAEMANACTQGDMRGEDALKLLKMVALAAIHAPGTDVVVAGIGARSDGTELQLFCYGEITRKFPIERKEAQPCIAP